MSSQTVALTTILRPAVKVSQETLITDSRIIFTRLVRKAADPESVLGADPGSVLAADPGSVLGSDPESLLGSDPESVSSTPECVLQ